MRLAGSLVVDKRVEHPGGPCACGEVDRPQGQRGRGGAPLDRGNESSDSERVPRVGQSSCGEIAPRRMRLPIWLVYSQPSSKVSEVFSGVMKIFKYFHTTPVFYSHS